MKFEIGSIERDSHECGELVKDYFARTIAGDGMAPLVFKWSSYKALENACVCKLFIARDDECIHGFALYIVQEHLHHDNQVIAQCDMIGVQPEMRGHGIGRRLIEHAEEWFREHGVTHMVHHHRVIYDVKPLFRKLGFRLAELGYVKEL